MAKHLKIVKQGRGYAVAVAGRAYVINADGVIGADAAEQQSFRDALAVATRPRGSSKVAAADATTTPTTRRRTTKATMRQMCDCVTAALGSNEASMTRAEIADWLAGRQGAEVVLDGDTLTLVAVAAGKLPLRKMLLRGDLVATGQRRGMRYSLATQPKAGAGADADADADAVDALDAVEAKQ